MKRIGPKKPYWDIPSEETYTMDCEVVLDTHDWSCQRLIPTCMVSVLLTQTVDASVPLLIRTNAVRWWASIQDRRSYLSGISAPFTSIWHRLNEAQGLRQAVSDAIPLIFTHRNPNLAFNSSFVHFCFLLQTGVQQHWKSSRKVIGWRSFPWILPAAAAGAVESAILPISLTYRTPSPALITLHTTGERLLAERRLPDLIVCLLLLFVLHK